MIATRRRLFTAIAYGVAEADSRNMVVNAMQGVRGRNFIGSPDVHPSL